MLSSKGSVDETKGSYWKGMEVWTLLEERCLIKAEDILLERISEIDLNHKQIKSPQYCSVLINSVT